jgi:hypothetical protein
VTADSVAHALEARRSGSGWMAKCPAHDDHNPSLSIRDSDGKVLVHCHAGCAQSDVIGALKARGVWQSEYHENPRIVDTYDYTDEHGDLLYQVVRYQPKGFKQRRPDGRGGWTARTGGRQVLYHLPEVIKAPIVFLVEGEKDVENLRSHGFVATTPAGGVDAPWLPSFTQTLFGREIIIIPDNDERGRQGALKHARELFKHAAQIILLELPGAGIKDISDWFDAGHSDLELINLVEREQVTG